MKQALRRTDIPVILLHNIDPRWEPPAVEEVLKDVKTMSDSLMAEGHPVIDLPVRSPDIEKRLKPYDPEKHIVLNWCEEIPTQPKSEVDVVALLEELSYTYTGSSSEVLALSWDKMKVKRILQEKGVSTPRGEIVSSEETDRWDLFPAIVKPSREHGSAGVTADAVVMDRTALRTRIAYIEKKYKQPAIVEDFIEGREIHATVWGNGRLEMLPPAEMNFSAFTETHRHLCTSDSKFKPGSEDFEKIELTVPAALDGGQLRQLEKLAIGSYRAIGCRDYARIDLRLRGDTFYVLDINPNADLSPETSTVFAAAATGRTYGQFVSGLVNLAAHRHPVFSLAS